jgi:hypothetical protein
MMHTLTGNDAATLTLNVGHSLGEQKGHWGYFLRFASSGGCFWGAVAQQVW